MTPKEKGTIKHELAAMFTADQAMRYAWAKGAPWDDAIDRKHTARLKELLKIIGGWPPKSIWGHPTASDFWLLVQHADHDVAFQRECLEALKALPQEEISLQHFAFLTDRVRMNEGRMQLYGSQLQKNAEGRYIPYNLEDPERTNERRAAVGLEPLEEYVEGANAHLS